MHILTAWNRLPVLISPASGKPSRRATRGAGLINVELTDQAGVRRVLMVRFPRAKTAIWTGVVSVLVFGLPWLFASLNNKPSSLPQWAIGLVAGLVLALVFGWFLVLLLITAVRGGFLALTQTGVLIHTGLSSVLIPWTAIRTVSADTDESQGVSNPFLRMTLRGDYKVPGWPWPSALSPVLIGSSRRKLRILGWWFQPVPVDQMVAIIGYLASHPEERPRIGRADPGEWLGASLAVGREDVNRPRNSSGDDRHDR